MRHMHTANPPSCMFMEAPAGSASVLLSDGVWHGGAGPPLMFALDPWLSNASGRTSQV